MPRSAKKMALPAIPIQVDAIIGSVVACDVATVQELKRVEECKTWGAGKPYSDMNIWVGCHSDALDVESLQSVGVNCVINAAAECGDHDSASLTSICDPKPADGLTVLRLDQRDHADMPIQQVFAVAAEYAQKALEAGGGVLVHCSHGISRGPTVTAAILMLLRQCSLDDALERIRVVRPQMNPNLGFQLQLGAFEQNEAEDFKGYLMMMSPAKSQAGVVLSTVLQSWRDTTKVIARNGCVGHDVHAEKGKVQLGKHSFIAPSGFRLASGGAVCCTDTLGSAVVANRMPIVA